MYLYKNTLSALMFFLFKLLH